MSGSEYRVLYQRWEHARWEAGAIDLTDDASAWAELPAEDRAELLWGIAACHVGDEWITQSLLPLVDAAPDEEQQVFLTTQLADEARHAVLRDRFATEVLGSSGLPGSPADDDARALMNLLAEAGRAAHAAPDDVGALVRGVTLHHLVVAPLCLSAQRFLAAHLDGRGLLPGLGRGLGAVIADKVRHVDFGIHLVGRAVATDPRLRQVADTAWEEASGPAAAFLAPPCESMRELLQSAAASLATVRKAASLG